MVAALPLGCSSFHFPPFLKGCACHKLCVALCSGESWDLVGCKCWDSMESSGSEFEAHLCHLPAVAEPSLYFRSVEIIVGPRSQVSGIT